jgi:hypothetical protein
MVQCSLAGLLIVDLVKEYENMLRHFQSLFGSVFGSSRVVKILLAVSIIV